VREGISARRAWAILLQGLVSGRCPNCGRASMFEGFYALHPRCPHCGVRHEIAEGAWLGAIAVGYGFGALFAFGLGLVELLYHPIASAGLNPLWTIAIVSIPVTALAYRPAKGLWFALLYLYRLGGEQ
jgi:uncharacterized protein (DUF983 family)